MHLNLIKINGTSEENDQYMTPLKIKLLAQSNTTTTPKRYKDAKQFEPSSKLTNSKELPNKEVSDDNTSENQSDAPTNIELLKQSSDYNFS